MSILPTQSSISTLQRFQANPLLRLAVPVAESLGLAIYPVGGCIRDTLLGQLPEDGIPDDTDCIVVSSGKHQAIDLAKALASKFHGSLVKLHPEFGIYRVVFHPETPLPNGELGKRVYLDLADALENSLEKDLSRRDLTINAIALDLTNAQIIDPHQGCQDLETLTIKAISTQNLIDDPLRLLRVFRFAAVLQKAGKTIQYDPDTLTCVKEQQGLILRIAGERIQEELFKLVSASLAFPALSKMAECGLLETLFPEMTPMRQIPPNGHHHLGLFEHTLELVKQSERLIFELPEDEQAYFYKPYENTSISHFGLVKLACLFHDLGKPDTMDVKQTQTGERFTYYGHDQVSADYTETICNRLKTGNHIKAHLMLLTRWHLYPCQFGKQSTKRSVMKFYRRLGDATPDVLLLALSDRHSTLGPDVTEAIVQREHENLLWLLENFRLEQQVLKLPPLLNGREIMQLLNLTPGPHLKDIINALIEAQQLGELQNADEARAWLLNNHSTI